MKNQTTGDFEQFENLTAEEFWPMKNPTYLLASTFIRNMHPFVYPQHLNDNRIPQRIV